VPIRIVRASLTIAAPLARVWDAVIDLPRYREWNPFIQDVSLDGPPAPGKRFFLHVRFASGRRFTSPERFTVIAPPRDGEATLAYDFDAWMHRLGLLHATRVQTLRQHSPDGPTHYETHETFTGPLAPFIPVAGVQAGFDAHALALKTRAEQ
jgi:uncharacterized protein YndB with AHSA1/START domain